MAKQLHTQRPMLDAAGSPTFNFDRDAQILWAGPADMRVVDMHFRLYRDGSLRGGLAVALPALVEIWRLPSWHRDDWASTTKQLQLDIGDAAYEQYRDPHHHFTDVYALVRHSFDDDDIKIFIKGTKAVISLPDPECWDERGLAWMKDKRQGCKCRHLNVQPWNGACCCRM